MERQPWKRIGAWLIDCGVILLYAGLLAVVGVPLYLNGVLPDSSTVQANLLSAVVLVVPVVVFLAGLETGRHRATLGKRVLSIKVLDEARGVTGWPRALLRNGLKVGLPWLIGHAAVFELTGSAAGGVVPVGTWILLAAAYLIPIVWLVSLFVGSGRTPYDRVAGTTVDRAGEPAD